MAFANITDPTGESEAVIFPRIYQHAKILRNKRVLQLRGKVEKRNDGLQLIVNEITAPQTKQVQAAIWKLEVPSRNNSSEFQTKLFDIFRKYHGKVPVILVYEDTNEHNELSEKFYLNDSSEVKEQLAELLGSQHISLIKNKF
ncbi:OB-fold nucleic acid binding domain-containing protein [Pediococcus pentosaceus]